jgi:hypothetical protein
MKVVMDLMVYSGPRVEGDSAAISTGGAPKQAHVTRLVYLNMAMTIDFAEDRSHDLAICFNWEIV